MRAASLVVLVSTVAVLLWVIWSLPVEPLINRFTKDDSFYYLATAANLARGHGCTFDGVNPTNGFHPLWMALLVPIYAVVGDDRVLALRIVLTFQLLVCVLPALLLIRRLVRSRGGQASLALVTGAALIMMPQRQLNALESGLVIVMGMVLLALAADRDLLSARSAPRDRVLAGIVLGLMFLSRTDTVFVIVAWFAVALMLHAREAARAGGVIGVLRWLLPTIIPILVLAGPYLAWNVLAFGHLMPISGALKSSLPRLTFSPFFFGWVTRGLLVVIAAGGIAALRALRGARAAPLEPRDRLAALTVICAAGALLHAAYTLFAMHWGVYSWHFALYAVPFLFIVAQWAMRLEHRFASRPAAARGFAVASVAVLLLAPVEVLWKFRRAEAGDFAVASYHAAIWARDHLPADARIGMKDSGAFGYFAERRVTNLDGVINNYRYQAYLRRAGLAEYVRDQGLRYIAQPEMRNNWPRADSAGYGAIEFRLPRDPEGGTFALAERDEVYRVAWGGRPASHFVIWRID